MSQRIVAPSASQQLFGYIAQSQVKNRGKPDKLRHKVALSLQISAPSQPPYPFPPFPISQKLPPNMVDFNLESRFAFVLSMGNKRSIRPAGETPKGQEDKGCRST